MEKILSILREKNEKGELPKKFSEDELKQIAKAEMGYGCAFCPMFQYEPFYPNTKAEFDEMNKNKVKNEENKEEK